MSLMWKWSVLPVEGGKFTCTVQRKGHQVMASSSGRGSGSGGATQKHTKETEKRRMPESNKWWGQRGKWSLIKKTYTTALAGKTVKQLAININWKFLEKTFRQINRNRWLRFFVYRHFSTSSRYSDIRSKSKHLTAPPPSPFPFLT